MRWVAVILAAALLWASPARGDSTRLDWPLRPRPAVVRTFDAPAPDWNRGHRGVAYHVKSRRDGSLGACVHVCGDRGRLEIAIAVVAHVGVRLAEPRGVRSQRAVDEQVTGKAAGAGPRKQVGGFVRACHRFAPVADDLDTVLDVPKLSPVGESTDVRPGAFVDGNDAQRGSGVERGDARLRSLSRGEQGTRRGTHLVMRVGGQRGLRMKPDAVGEVRCQPAQRRRGHRRVDVDPGHIRGPVADRSVDIVGGRADRTRPGRLVPTVGPERAVGVGAGVVGEQPKAILAGFRGAQV